MGTSITNRKKQAIKTKKRIFDVTLALMDKNGFDNVNIQDICKAAKVSTGTFYYYYNSKNDVFFELYKRADHFFEETVATALKAAHTIDRLVEYFDFYAQYCIDTGIHTMTLMMNASNKNFIKKGRYMQTLAIAIIDEGKRKGEISTEAGSEDICNHLFILARGILFDWCLHSGDYDLAQRMREYIEPIIRSLGDK